MAPLSAVIAGTRTRKFWILSDGLDHAGNLLVIGHVSQQSAPVGALPSAAMAFLEDGAKVETKRADRLALSSISAISLFKSQ